jgi:transglutaminase-like putative cysteine protease
MTYRIVHRTTYKYKYPVAFGNHVACLTPRTLAHHRCVWSKLHIDPTPSTHCDRLDYYGNQLSFFTIQEPHKQLVVEARSEVSLDTGRFKLPSSSPAWEEVASELPQDRSTEGLEAYQFVFESPRIKPSPEFGAYAARSFTAKRPIVDGLLDLTERIHRDFLFDSKATNVRTSTEEVFRKRRGVCQDFAHLQIACLRSLKLPARYVSGYLRTYPPPGRPRLIGADASHAWVSVFCPGSGWIDLDPTNNVVVGDGHVTLGWGRDYGDVSPLRGLILGGRDHTLKVSVDVEPDEG